MVEIDQNSYLHESDGIDHKAYEANMPQAHTFDVSQLSGETAIIFNHLDAQNYEGASIFWIRRLAALEGEDAAIGHWQLKRDGTTRGIIEVITP